MDINTNLQNPSVVMLADELKKYILSFKQNESYVPIQKQVRASLRPVLLI